LFQQSVDVVLFIYNIIIIIIIIIIKEQIKVT